MMVGNGSIKYKEAEDNGKRVHDTLYNIEWYIEYSDGEDAEDVQQQGKKREEEDGFSSIATEEDTMSLLHLLDATFRSDERGGVDHGGQYDFLELCSMT